MIKQYITQALAQLRQHPLISAVSIIGTALAIFLIMLVVMMGCWRSCAKAWVMYCFIISF